MTIRTNTPNVLDNPPAPVQAKLAAAWTSFMFLYIYVGYFHLYKPGAIDEIRGGVIFKFDISPTLLTIFLASVAIPALMVVLSMTLPARVNRATNLVVALLYIPFSAFNAVGGPGPGPPSTASPSESRCCSWPSSCAPPGNGLEPPPSQPVPRRPTFDSRYPCKPYGVKPAAAELIGKPGVRALPLPRPPGPRTQRNILICRESRA
jgi:hypothetical protein